MESGLQLSLKAHLEVSYTTHEMHLPHIGEDGVAACTQTHTLSLLSDGQLLPYCLYAVSEPSF